jgi:hypothetical protein
VAPLQLLIRQFHSSTLAIWGVEKGRGCSSPIDQQRRRCKPYRPGCYTCSSRSRHCSPNACGRMPRCCWRARFSLPENARWPLPYGSWARRPPTLPPVPSGAQPSCMVESRSESHPTWVADSGIRCGRSTHPRHRRDSGETLGQEDRGQGHLPRRGSLQSRALGQG